MNFLSLTVISALLITTTFSHSLNHKIDQSIPGLWLNGDINKPDDTKNFYGFNTLITKYPKGSAHWYLKTQQLYYSNTDRTIETKGTTFYINKLPVLYLPTYNISLQSKKAVGFLIPKITNNHQYGLILKIPYAFKLPEGQSATVEIDLAKSISRFNTEIKYQNQHSNSYVRIEFMPKKPAFLFGNISNHRGAFVALHENDIGNLHVDLEISFISDKDYLTDFHQSLAVVSKHVLPQKINVAYINEDWQVYLLTQLHQCFHKQKLYPLYDIVPQVTINHTYHYKQFARINTSTSYTRFVSHDKSQLQHTINRICYQPQLKIGTTQSTVGFNTSVGLNIKSYEIHNQQPKQQLLSLTPIYSANMQWSISNHISSWWQTISPRIKYLLIPYTPQQAIPAIDASYQLSTYDNLFKNNRFNGQDRIGDTNHLAYGVASKLFFGHNSKKVITFNIGQRYYFSKRKVCILNNMNLEEKITGFISNTRGSSPIAVSASWQEPIMRWQYDIVYNPKNNLAHLARYSLQYQRTKKQILNFSLSYVQNGATLSPYQNHKPNPNLALYQVNTSGKINITNNWNLYYGLSYNVIAKYCRNYFAGIEYNGPSWLLRVFAGKIYHKMEQQEAIMNNKVYVQFALNGLGINSGTENQGSLEYHLANFN